MNIIKNHLLYASLEKAEFHRLIPQARLENESKLKIYALVSFGLFLVLGIVNASIRIFPVSAIFSYAIMALFSGTIYVLAQKLPSRSPSATTGLCYIFIAALYAFSLVNSAMHPDIPAVVAIAIMLMGPFLFTERPIHLIGMNIAAIVLLCALSFRIKARGLALIDLWNAIAFGIISIAAEITAENLRFKLLAQADRIKYLSETDLMTGCKNRNCYLDRFYDFPGMCKKNLVCAYFDVNGLHNLNEDGGHDAGDKMLKAVAQALLDTYDPEHVYRIGGDEFVFMGIDVSVEETRQKAKRVSDILAAQNYSVCVGIVDSEKEELDIDKLTKEADELMYREKEIYYQQEGHDRRRR